MDTYKDNAKQLFCTEVIHEYVKHDSDGYYLYVYQIPFEVLKLFMSKFMDADDYEDALASTSRTMVYIEDYRQIMQEFIDAEIDNMNQAHMDEHGIHWLRTSNGDYVCARKY
jgi:uncharacterized protein YqgQ